MEGPNPLKKRQIARDFGVSDTTIRHLLKQSDLIKRRALLTDVATRTKTKRDTQEKFPELEDLLFKWIEDGRKVSLELPPSLVMQKARQIALQLNISEDFKGSSGWLAKFRARFGLQALQLHGEGAEIDKNNPVTLKALDELYKIVDQYDPAHIYNMDETGLFFRLLPRYTLLLPNEDLRTTRGKKKAKKRVSLVPACNAIGSDKVLLCMIGKPTTPACIRGHTWPLFYFSQKSASMDMKTFKMWFETVVKHHVCQRTGSKVLLLLDNAPGHGTGFESDRICVLFFPPNVSAWKQPMDMGIIATMKKWYKYLTMKDIINFHDFPCESKNRLYELTDRMPQGKAGVNFGKAAHLLDAANYANEAWGAFSQETLLNFWRKADVVSSLKTTRHDGIPVVDKEPEMQELTRLIQNCSLAGEFAMSTEYILNKLRAFLEIDDEETLGWQESVIEDMDQELVLSLTKQRWKGRRMKMWQ